MLPVVAAADGVVRWIGSECCILSIDHGGGWETWYIHLNNDTPGTDDGLGWGIAPGIERGTSVHQGQLIGWVGDSGNAEWTVARTSISRSSTTTWRSTPIRTCWLPPASALPMPGCITGPSPTTTDRHEADIEKLVATGVTKGCSTEPMLYCPDESITRGQIAAFITRALALPPSDVRLVRRRRRHPLRTRHQRRHEAGIGFGCDADRYCPDRPLLREEMATLLVRAFGLVASGVDWFEDTTGNPHLLDIDAIATAGVTLGCQTEPALYCPRDTVTRAQMASFFSRAMGL
jgi:hypothetical protein